MGDFLPISHKKNIDMGKKSPIFLFLWEKDDIFARKRS